MKNKKSIGKLGEDAVGEYLKEAGYEILHKNFRCKAGEIDIIAKDDDVIVFIEVKTRRSLAFGYPSESVTYQKQMRIKKVAEYYILKNRIYNEFFRFDVVEVYMGRGERVEKINLIKNAF